MFEGAVARVPKFGHTFPKAYDLDPAETAVLCVLLLRGPQTPGELRSSTGHLHNFESLAAVEETIQKLSTRAEPLILKLPRAPGMKEARYAHLLGGEIRFAPSNVEGFASGPGLSTAEDLSEVERSSAVEGLKTVDIDRLTKLEAEVAALRKELDELKAKLS